MTKKPIYSVALIGLGNVGLLYDIEDFDNKKFLTHAKSFSKHLRFRLVAGVDPNENARNLFSQAYKTISAASLDAIGDTISPDVVVISSPTEFHLSSIEQVFKKWRPQAVLCEKPLAYKYSDAARIMRICNEHGAHLFVNFFRISDPGVAAISQRISEQTISSHFSGVSWYCKGLKNNGIHFVNLLQHLFGKVYGIRVIGKGRQWNDNDLEPEFELSFKTGRVVFLPCKSENYFHNSIELITTNGRLRYDNSGAKITWLPAENDLRFPGYVKLGLHEQDLSSDYDLIQLNVTDQLAYALDGEDAAICSGQAALDTQEIISEIEKLTHKDKHDEHSR